MLSKRPELNKLPSGYFRLNVHGTCSGIGNTNTPEEIRNEQIEDQLSPWDGSYRAETKIIKAAMNDPNSFGHVLNDKSIREML